MNMLQKLMQTFCNHLPIEAYRFTRTNGTHVQHKIRYQCFKCGKRMKG